MIELLSPAGDFECLKAAVQNGADAVYFGASSFSARAFASNFDDEALEKAITYAKLRGVKTNLALNTLIKNDEMNDAIELAKKAYSYGIDAIIVQDLGLACYLIKHFPDLDIHASTQLSVHNLEGVLKLQEMGFSEVYEVALGADIGAVAEAHHYVNKVVSGELPFLLTSCCPSWAMLAKKQFPDLIDQISQELTPMVATARTIKQEHPNAKVVFIGPCAAKKLEASRRTVRSDVDFVVTFEELQAMFDAKGIDLTKYEAESSLHDATGAGRGYACAGGVAEAIEKCIKEYYPGVDVNIEHAEGLAECRKTLLLAKAGKMNGCLIEGMGCPGGCIAGAGTNIPIPQAKKDVATYVKNSTKSIPPKELENIELK